MNKIIVLIFSVSSVFISFSQADVEIMTTSDRSIEPATRIFNRPKMLDTSITTSVTQYPLLVLQKQTDVSIEEIEPAKVNTRPQLSKLYNVYAKIGAGSRLQALGEIYINSMRSRKYHWGIHGKHHSEWGRMKNVAPSQYDISSGKAFGSVKESRYSFGGEVEYANQGLHYYGFENPDAKRDSIQQRYQKVGFQAFYESHKKDSATLNYRIGVEYANFMDKKPNEDALKAWRGVENYVALKTQWQYNGSNNVLLSNLKADLDISHNNYKYGIENDSLSPYNHGLISENTVIQLRPLTSFYGMGEKLLFSVGGELALDYNQKMYASIYPIAEVSYSLFNDIFIPYIGVEGGLKQQRFEWLAKENEFIGSNHLLKNKRVYEGYFGIKGTLSSRVSFNVGGKYAYLNNYALFMNDTLNSSGNQFRVDYDTLRRLNIVAGISYQQNEKLKIDLIGHYYKYWANHNLYAWHKPVVKIIGRGTYNVADRLIATVDVVLEADRKALATDTTIAGVKEKSGVYYHSVGFLADANIGVEFRYSKRFSIFANFNNIAAQNYKRWYGYPVNGFQALVGFTYRF